MNEREQALQMVSDAIIPLRRIDELYYTALNLKQQSEAYATLSEAKSKNTGSVYAAIAAFVTMEVVFYIWKLIGAALYFVFGKLLEVLKIGDFLAGLYLLVAVACSLVAAYFVYKYVKKRTSKNAEDNTTNLVADNEQKIEQISNEIERVATEGADHINQLPRDYRNYNAAQFFESALANGRADNMKEAVNLYEDELHKMRMENMSAQTLRASEQQARMLASIEESSRVTANVSKANLVFNVLAFLDRV